jgi:hypothetical protein
MRARRLGDRAVAKDEGKGDANSEIPKAGITPAPPKGLKTSRAKPIFRRWQINGTEI